MTWVRIDDRALAHPKLLKVGPDGVCLWLAGLCYANAHSTNGLVPKVALPLLYASAEWSSAKAMKAATKLVAARLWYDDGESWRIHDYDHYQGEALKDRTEERKERDRVRKAEKRAATKAASNVSADMSADNARTNNGLVRGQTPDSSADILSDAERTCPQEVLAQPRPHPRTAAPAPAHSRARDPVPSRPVQASESESEERAHAPDATPKPPRAVDETALHEAWSRRWKALGRGEPSGGSRSMAGTCWAPEWRELATKIAAHSAAIGMSQRAIAEHALDALFASADPFVAKDRNPKLLVSQFQQWAPTERVETPAEASARIARQREAERVIDPVPPPQELRDLLRRTSGGGL